MNIECSKSPTRLHDTVILFNTPKCMIKGCVRCKEEFVFNKDYKGDIDTQSYVDVCLRDFIQPSDLRYKTEYGQPL